MLNLTVMAMVDKLAARSLIIRVKSETDRRKQELHLTPLGQKTLAKVRAQIAEHEKRFTARFSVELRAQRRRSSRHLCHSCGGTSLRRSCCARNRFDRRADRLQIHRHHQRLLSCGEARAARNGKLCFDQGGDAGVGCREVRRQLLEQRRVLDHCRAQIAEQAEALEALFGVVDRLALE